MNIYISDDKIRRNINYIKLITGIPNSNFVAVLKDNAYGHGIQHIASLLCNEGIYFFAVASIDEAISIRNINDKARVLILKRVNDELLEYAVKYRFDLMIGDENYLRKVIEVAQRVKLKPLLHIKVNEKLNRWGFSFDDRSLYKIKEICGQNYPIEGVAIQFKATYNYDSSVDDNLSFYDSVRLLYEKFGVNAKFWHFRTTSDINRSVEKNEIVRMGAGIYGIPNNRDGLLKFFQPAMRGESFIYATKEVDIGETIGYKGQEFVAYEKMIIGLVADGFAQGIRKDSCLYVLGKKRNVLVVFLDITIIQIDSTELINEIVEIQIENGEGRSSAEQTCDYGNSLLNKVIYE